MARIRTVKPAFFRHRQLFLSEQEAELPLRVAFAGLWTCADREGRFRWEPEELKLDCLPYDEVDFSRVLDALTTRGFLVKYASGGKLYGVIPSFTEHQIVNNREQESKLPVPPEPIQEQTGNTREARDDDASVTRHDLAQVEQEGKGREQEGNGCSASRTAPPSVDPLVEGLKAEGITVANAPEPIAPDHGPPMLLFLIKPGDHRAALWGPGADFVAGRCEISRDRAKGIIGKWLKDSKDNAVRVFDLLAECQLKEKFDPRSWVTARLQGDSTENAERKAADDKIYRNVL